MIVDCHTHIWASADQLGAGAREHLRRQGMADERGATVGELLDASQCVDKTLILGYRCAQLGADIPNDSIAGAVARHPDRLIGIAGVDPAADGVSDAKRWLEHPAFRGITVGPASQGFHPSDSRAMKIYALAEEKRAAVFFNQGAYFPSQGRMEYARPFLLDEIAREFPSLTIVITSLGYPWVDEGIALLSKHPRVFGDVAGLVRRPWQAYSALVLAHQFRVMDKVLFASDFPYGTAADAIQNIYRLHEITQGTNLPGVPREELRSVVERDALSALEIARPGEEPQASRDEDEDL
jgi:predicted TIM-barrel fold metal-dependent hydrolase